MASDYPSRIVCLSAEVVDVLYRLGCGERIVGVTGFAVEPPEARRKPKVSGFSSFDYEKIDALRPEIIVASWCGKKANSAAISQRPGWETIPAVRNGRVHEIDSAEILQPGPSLLKGLRQLREIIQSARR